MENENRIFVSGPSITDKEVEYVSEAVRKAWYGNANYYNEKFEHDFKNYVGCDYAIALPSCTSALHLALLALGVGKGDEVIVPDITWIATAAPVCYVGAKPVFADVEEDTWCLSPSSVEKNISPKTKAIIMVDLYGNVPDVNGIKKIAEKYKIPIIEDAAEAIGSSYNNLKAGSLGCIGTFSFHGSKTMTTGEGGMLVTNDKDIYSKCLKFRDHGRAISDKMFWNDLVAFKYKMSSMQAALGIAQLERIEELVNHKREIFYWYEKNLKGIDRIKLNCEKVGIKNSYWMVTIVWEHEVYGITKEEFIKELKKFNIDSRPFFYPLSMLPAFKDLSLETNYSKLNAASYKISPYSINLPCGMDMNLEKVNYVCDKVKEILLSVKNK